MRETAERPKVLVRALAGAALMAASVVAGVALATPASAASLTQITGFGNNPTNLSMYLYVPDGIPAGTRAPILLALHYCTGSGPAFYSGTQFASLADQYKFIVIYPSATRSGQCWDVSSSAALTRNGGSDPVGLKSMIDWVVANRNGDSGRVYVTGSSSGGMMTNVMLGDYPDVFKAGAAFMGVPFGCFATTDGSSWNSQCANGQLIKTAQQWGDLVRAAYPGYSGARPRMQLWHGTNDGTLNYNNFGEEIKQWTNVLGVSQTPVSTDTPQSGWTRTRYGNTGTQAPVEGISISGVGHELPLSGQAAMAIAFFGLNGTTPPVTTPPQTTSPPPTGGTCSVTVTRTNEWSDRFNVSLAVSGATDWIVSIYLSGSQSLQNSWNATVTGTTGTLTAVPNGSGNTFGITLYKNGDNTNPTASCATNQPPATTNPPPVTTNPPPVTTNPPPVTTVPPPVTTTAPPPVGACSASYRLVNSWPGGFQGEVTVSAGTSGVSNWRVNWTNPSGQTITQLWSGTLSTSGQTSTVTPLSWNSNIPANGSIAFGFLGSGPGTVSNLTCAA